MRPKISVIIPVYNEERYLGQCLDSVLRQPLREIEVICVDDASTDRTPLVLAEYMAKDRRLRVIRNETNLRAGISRNRGIEAARGEYIHFIDADDYLAQDAYRVLYKKARLFNLDLVKAKAYSVDAVTQNEVLFPRYDLLNLTQGDFNVLTNFHEDPKKFSTLPVTPWSGLYRREFLLENNIRFNDLVCVNDRSFHNEVMIKAGRVMFMDHFILYYRVNVAGSLIGKRAKNFDCLIQSYQIIKGQCAGLTQKEQYHILDSALHDMFNWYRKYQNEGVYQGEINMKMSTFIKQLDIVVFGKKMHLCRWYVDYMNLRGLKPAVTHKIARSARGFARLAQRTIRYGRNYGVRCFVRLAMAKAGSMRDRQLVYGNFR